MPLVIEKDQSEIQERLLARLPAKARRKLTRWLQDEQDAHALRVADAERLQELRKQKGAAERELLQLEHADHEGKLVVERMKADEKSPSGYVTEKVRDVERLESAKARIATLQDQIDRLSSRAFQRTTNPTSGLISYLSKLRQHADLQEQASPTPKRPNGESIEAAVERLRASIRELKNEGDTVALAPIPSALAKQRIDAELLPLAERGRPRFSPVLERAGRASWPSYPLTGVQLTASFVPQLQDGIGFTAWFLKDFGRALESGAVKLPGFSDEQRASLGAAFRAALAAAVGVSLAEEADDENALTDDQRRSRLKTIAEEILSLERMEESLIELGEAEGVQIIRRGDSDPRAVLGLSSALSAPDRRRA